MSGNIRSLARVMCLALIIVCGGVTVSSDSQARPKASKKASKTASKKASFNKVFVGDVSRMSSGPAGKKKTLKKKKKLKNCLL